MKKWMWVFPAFVFLLSLGAVVYLRMRDVSPALLIGAEHAAAWASLSETEAVTLLERHLPAFTSGENLPDGITRTGDGAFVLETRPGGFVQALLPAGVAWPPHEPALNTKIYARALPAPQGWQYVLSYDVPLVQANRYTTLVAAQTDPAEAAASAETWVCLLFETAGLPEPAALSKSKYVVAVLVPRENGTAKKAFVDPRNLVFLGWE